MGVEARTQVCRDGGLEDSPITSRNHPLRSRLRNGPLRVDLKKNQRKSRKITGKSSQIFGKSQEVCWKLQQEPGWQKEKASKTNTHLDVLDLVALALPSVSLNDFLLSQESDRFSTRPLFSILEHSAEIFEGYTYELMMQHSAVTRAHLILYATRLHLRNFDLIAERKHVIFQLRELAKARAFSLCKVACEKSPGFPFSPVESQ